MGHARFSVRIHQIKANPGKVKSERSRGSPCFARCMLVIIIMEGGKAVCVHLLRNSSGVSFGGRAGGAVVRCA